MFTVFTSVSLQPSVVVTTSSTLYIPWVGYWFVLGPCVLLSTVPSVVKSHSQLFIVAPFPFDWSVKVATTAKHTSVVSKFAMGLSKTSTFMLVMSTQPLSEVTVSITL